MLLGEVQLIYKESDLQQAVATFLNGLESAGQLAWSHPPNEGKRHVSYARKLKSHGVKAGEPDCLIFLKGGDTLFIELKTSKGRVEIPQKQRHMRLRSLGFEVWVVYAETPQEAVKKVADILKPFGVA